MSSQQVELKGQICVGGSVCTDPCGGPPSSKIQGLALSCANAGFQCVVSTDIPCAVQTPGAVGAAYDDLPATDSLDLVQLLYVKSSNAMRLRVGADVARLVSSGLALPLAGGETLDTVVDGQPTVTTTFTAAATAAAVVNEINAAAALLGQAPPASLNASGALELAGALTGAEGSVRVTGGTAQALLGFAAGTNDAADGLGEDTDFNGIYLVEFGSGSPPSRIQISGQGTVEVFAAGTPAP
jgi:hypothetical protein